MDESIKQDINSDKVKTKTSSWNTFMYGFFAALVIVVIATIVIVHSTYKAKIKNKQAQEMLDKQNAIYQKARASIILDSLKLVEIEKEKFRVMQFRLHLYDSAKNSLRYKVGSIVYIKPDSVIAVVKDIKVDNYFYYYSYLLVISNKDGNETLCERTDKMIY